MTLCQHLHVRILSILSIAGMIVLCMSCQPRVIKTGDDVVNEELRSALQKRLQSAQKMNVDLFSPGLYQQALAMRDSAEMVIPSKENTVKANVFLERADILLDSAITRSKVVQNCVAEPFAIVSRIDTIQKLSIARNDLYDSADVMFAKAIQYANQGDTLSSKKAAQQSASQFNRFVVQTYSEVIIPSFKEQLSLCKDTLDKKVVDEASHLVDSITKQAQMLPLDQQSKWIMDAGISTIEKTRNKLFPSLFKKIPTKLEINDFLIVVETFKGIGNYDAEHKIIHGVSGTGWIVLDCMRSVGGSTIIGTKPVKRTFAVVKDVINPSSQISLDVAKKISPMYKLGEEVEITLQVRRETYSEIVKAKETFEAGLVSKTTNGIPVFFDTLSIGISDADPKVGKILKGEVKQQTGSDLRTPQVTLGTFAAEISNLKVSISKGATADLRVKMPRCLGSFGSCTEAQLQLNNAKINRKCSVFETRSTQAYGPWIMASTGMVISGTGFTADFSTDISETGIPAAWIGIRMKDGTVDGSKTNPKNANTGFLCANYAFSSSSITDTGFSAQTTLKDTLVFSTVNPLDYQIATTKGKLSFSHCTVDSGALEEGIITFPMASVRSGTALDKPLEGTFAKLAISSALELSGEILFANNTQMQWGNFSNPSFNRRVWKQKVAGGQAWFPAEPQPSFSPDTGNGFIASGVSNVNDMKNLGAAGVSSGRILDLNLYSSDLPKGTADSLWAPEANMGWYLVGANGIDGYYWVTHWKPSTDVGNTAKSGYKSNSPFKTVFGGNDQKYESIFKVAQSAVYDVAMNGRSFLGLPCSTWIPFDSMGVTSTGDFTAAKVILPPEGVPLTYWKLLLKPTGTTQDAGVMSIRTGQIILTAAGIQDTVHFLKPFPVLWGELLAEGSIGELFMDYNTNGQRFDQLQFAADGVKLSPYVVGSKKGYLAASGIVSFPYWGAHYINIRDERNDDNTASPYFGRNVTVPSTTIASSNPTSIVFNRNWENAAGLQLATFNFPSGGVGYHVAAQNGFIGTGTARVAMIGGLSASSASTMNATVEIHGPSSHLCFTSNTTHDLDLGLFQRIGGMDDISGCAVFENNVLSCLTIHSVLERSTNSGMGILAPKSGYMSEVIISMKPTSLTCDVAGVFKIAAGGSAIDLFGELYLKRDFSRSSVEGMALGSLDANAVVAGLHGEGQLTWYADPSSFYIQGRAKVSVCGYLIGSGGMEGGFFVGVNAPKENAWAIYSSSNPHFGLSQSILPAKVSGFYGYGEVSLGTDFGIFSGGFDLYAGMGFLIGAANPVGAVMGSVGVNLYGEILWGLVSASGWANLDLIFPPPAFEGTLGLEGCVLWFICGSVDLTIGLSSDGDFYIR